MPSRSELARIASRYDTVMSRAMLLALGYVPCVEVRRAPGGRAREREIYQGFMWCFRNFGSPLR